MKAAIYSRFGTDRQNECSIEDQVRVCMEYASKNGLAIVAQFDDQGISGTALGNRPGILAVQRAAVARSFDVLLVRDVQRVARGEDLPPLIKRLKFREVQVIGVLDGYDSAAQGSETRTGLEGITGTQYVESARRFTHSGLKMRAEGGRHTGGRSYGYTTMPDGKYFKCVIREDEAVVVREIFSMYAGGSAYRTIASDLNKRGVLSPGASWSRKQRRCGGWMDSGVRAILFNERYAGRIIWNKSIWVKNPDSGVRVRRIRPQAEWVIRQDDSQRIVSEELWERVKLRIAGKRDGVGKLIRGGLRKRSGGGGRTGKYPLSGVLECGCCKANFVLRNRSHYACGSWWSGHACDVSINVPRKLVEHVIIEDIRDTYRNPARLDAVESLVQQLLKERKGAKPVDQSKGVAQLEREIENLVAAIGAGALSRSPAIAQRLAKAEAELAAIHAERKNSHKPSPLEMIVPNIRKHVLAGVAQLDSVLKEGDPDRSREALRNVIENRKIVLKPHGSGRHLVAHYGLKMLPLIEDAMPIRTDG